MTDLPWSMNATFSAVPSVADAPRFVCNACCDRCQLIVNENGLCITQCEFHPQIMIRDGKVVGTSA